MHGGAREIGRPVEGRVVPLSQFRFPVFLIITLIWDVILIVAELEESISLGCIEVDDLGSVWIRSLTIFISRGGARSVDDCFLNFLSPFLVLGSCSSKESHSTWIKHHHGV